MRGEEGVAARGRGRAEGGAGGVGGEGAWPHGPEDAPRGGAGRVRGGARRVCAARRAWLRWALKPALRVSFQHLGSLRSSIFCRGP